uniref:NADH-ubiquinone oxidoreductase chain 3 n=1 Tax=Onchidella borealis TaxID=244421 RepID=E6Y1C8_9EUPU|nr:NADH dehydrogenase subunit 3 [Onchidella borealis]
MFFSTLCVVFTLSLALFLVYFFTSSKSFTPWGQKLTPFECGFEPLSGARTPFSTRFFILVVLFLIFDVEIALLFPLLNMLNMFLPHHSGMIILLFVIILLLGLIHEWNEGALSWVSL